MSGARPRGAHRYATYRLRCSSCDHRRTSHTDPVGYIRPPACELCGSKRWRVDWYRTTRKESRRRGVCYCNGRHFPHRPGTEITEWTADKES